MKTYQQPANCNLAVRLNFHGYYIYEYESFDGLRYIYWYDSGFHDYFRGLPTLTSAIQHIQVHQLGATDV